MIAADKEVATTFSKSNLEGLPQRAYLDETVIPILIEGLKVISKERPPNPTEFLGIYLLKNSNK
jgi:protein dpy-30